MGVTVGEVNAVLRAQDEMSSVFEKAGAAAKGLGQGIEEAGEKVGDFGDKFMEMSERIVERLAIYEAIKKSFEFIKESVEGAARLYELSEATGIATDALQQMNYVAIEAGVSGELMARSVEMLSSKLANGDKNATLAVQQLGLSVDQLLAEGPAAAFTDIADAAGRIDDPMTKAGVVADLFGQRLGRQLIPLLGEFREKMAAVPGEALISADTIKKAHDFEVQLEHLKMEGEAVFVEGLSFWQAKAASFFSFFTGGSGEIDKVNHAVEGHADALSKDTAAHGPAITAEQLYQNELRALLANQTKLTDEDKLRIETMKTLGATTTEIEKATHLNSDAVASYLEVLKKAKEEEKKFNDAMKELVSVGEDWHKTLEDIDGETVDAVKYYLQAGVSQHTLAEAYGLTAAQVKAVAAELKNEAEAQKLAAKEEEEHTKLMAQYRDLVAQYSGSTTEKQIADIHKWADDLIAQHKKAGTDTVQFYDDVARIANLKLGQVGVNHAELDSMSKQHFQNIADAARATYEEALAHADQFTKEGLEALHEKMLQAIDDANNWGDIVDARLDKANAKAQAVAKSMDSIGSSFTYDLSTDQGIEQYKKMNPAATVEWSDAQIEDYIKKGGTLQGLIASGVIFPYAGMGHAAEGGLVTVGEHGPELVSLPVGAAVYPNGTVPAGGGGSIVNHFYVNGTGADVARQVSETLMKQLKTVRHFGAA